MDRFELTIAPDVVFPDWSVVTSAHVERALVALLGEDRMLARWTGLSASVRATHVALLNAFATVGRAPQTQDLVALLELPAQTVRQHVVELAARDLVVVRNGAIEGAYPFTDRDTGHVVEIDGVAVNAMCAIDALGIGAMFGRPATIRSRCAGCGASVTIEVGGAGRKIDDRSPDTTMVWVGLREIDGCAADTQCRSMVFFCSDRHCSASTDESGTRATGYRLSVPEALEAGAAIFRPFIRAGGA